MHIMVPPPSDLEIRRSGIPLLYVDTGAQGGNWILEQWIQALRKASGQQIDWGYVAGIALVRFLGDKDAIVKAMKDTPPPQSLTLTRV